MKLTLIGYFTDGAQLGLVHEDENFLVHILHVLNYGSLPDVITCHVNRMPKAHARDLKQLREEAYVQHVVREAFEKQPEVAETLASGLEGNCPWFEGDATTCSLQLLRGMIARMMYFNRKELNYTLPHGQTYGVSDVEFIEHEDGSGSSLNFRMKGEKGCRYVKLRNGEFAPTAPGNYYGK